MLGRGEPTFLFRRSSQNQGRIKMLVLSRKAGEKLIIDGNITVVVVRIQGNRVTLGFTAPSDVKIMRGELNQPTAGTEPDQPIVEDKLSTAC